MLSDTQMRTIAEKYINFLNQVEGQKELKLYPLGDELKKTYGSIFPYNTKKYYNTKNLEDQVMTTPFLVEKATGRIVNFGSSDYLELSLSKYEKGTLALSSDGYWYHETETYSSK